jgi:hypothetical protein
VITWALLLLALQPKTTAVGTLAALTDEALGAQRTLAASALLLGTPYAKEPLGEGDARHPEPRLRLDRMDCQTFVETAIALGEAVDEAQLRAALDDVRYGSTPAYDNRNHFMMSQWVPRNTAKGYLRDVTAELFPDAKVASKVVTAQSWAARWPKTIQLPPDKVPLGEHRLAFVPLAEISAAQERIPAGTLLVWVRAESPRYPDRVTHLGFLVRNGDQVFLRHESDVYHRVVDEPLAHFIARNSRYEWKVLGASLFAVEDNSAHVRALDLAAHARR